MGPHRLPRTRHRMGLPTLLALVALVLPAAAGGDYAWTLPENLSQTAGRSTFPSLAQVSPGGDLWAVWTDAGSGSGDIMGRHRGAAGTWDGVLNLSDNAGREAGSSLYVDRAGRGHLAWTRWGNPEGTEIAYRQWADGAWGPILVLDDVNVNPFPYNLLFAEDISGTVWLFANLGSEVRYTRLGADGWDPLSGKTFLSGLKGLGTITSGNDGLFHVALYGANECSPCGPYDEYFSDPYYATTDGTTWSPFINLGGVGTVAYDIALDWDTAGALHLAWSDIDPPQSLDSDQSAVYERVLQGGVWGARAQVSVPNAGQAIEDLALQADGSGRVHAVWSEGVFSGTGAIDLDIRYRRWTAAGWGEEEPVYTSTLDSINVDMAIGQLGEPAVVWEEGESDAEEVYFSQRQVSWPYHAYLPRVERHGAR